MGKLQVRVTSRFGAIAIYPECKVTKAVASIAKRSTLSFTHLVALTDALNMPVAVTNCPGLSLDEAVREILR